MDTENYFQKNKIRNIGENPRKLKYKQTKDNPKPIFTCCFAVKMMLCRVPKGPEKLTQLGISSSYMLMFLRYLREYYMPGGLEYELKLSKKKPIYFLYCMYL